MLKRSSAFTMMEIMVVLFIIGFLFAFLGPRVMKYFLRSNTQITRLKMANIKDNLIEYQQDMGHFPNKKEGGLGALLICPQGAEGKWQGYLKDEDDLMDKWNDEFEFNMPPVKYKGKYKIFEIISSGGEEGNEIVDGA